MKVFRAMMKHPGTTLLVGLILIGTAGYEVYETIQHEESMKIRGHHGVLVYGILQCLKSIPDLLEGAEQVTGV